VNQFQKLIFGGVQFSEAEEYQAFQFHFLYALLLMGILFSGAFILTDHLQLNHLAAWHVSNNKVFFAVSIALTFALYGHKERFLVVAWICEIASLLIYLSALLLVQDDPMRILWFFLNLPAVYILLGRSAEIGISVVTLMMILIGNVYTAEAYSANALTTMVIGLAY